jgi:mannose-6-phosphate isomerase-like protein (cupin superfamily)
MWRLAMGDPHDTLPTPGTNMGRPGWTLIASAAVTNGGFEVFEELRVTPGGPPPHIHRERDEAFYVVEGRYTFMRGDEVFDLGPGGFVFIPRGSRHHFRTLEAPSRTLILIVPAGLEDFFREMGSRIDGGASALEAMTALAGTYDSHPVD